jgi:hypothetical protein
MHPIGAYAEMLASAAHERHRFAGNAIEWKRRRRAFGRNGGGDTFRIKFEINGVSLLPNAIFAERQPHWQRLFTGSEWCVVHGSLEGHQKTVTTGETA